MISESRNGCYDMPLEYRPKGSYTVYIRIISDNPDNTSFALGFTESPSVVSDADESVRFLFEDNHLDYQSINPRGEFVTEGFKLTFLGLAKDDTYLYIKLIYHSPIEASVGVRLPGRDISEAFGLNKFLPGGTKIGKNLFIIRLEKEKVTTYPDTICVEVGDDHSVGIDKELVNDFIAE
jgi:hypothetical protein